ncbi:MAG: DUF4397 domain-containing protein [Acidobacteriaceae bacterium]
MNPEKSWEMAGAKVQVLWRRIAGGMAAAAVIWPLCACQSVSQSQTTSLVRVVDASYNAPAVDVYAGKTEIAQNVAAGTITHYAILAPGAVTITVDAAGTKTPLETLTATLGAAGQHSVYLTDAGSGFVAKLLTDRAESSPLGDFSVRFLQAAPTTGAVDVYYLAPGQPVSSATPVVKGLGPGQDSGYVNVPDGTYVLMVTRAGSAEPVFMGSSATYAGGEVRTVLIQDEPAAHAQPVRVVVGDDQN